MNYYQQKASPSGTSMPPDPAPRRTPGGALDYAYYDVRARRLRSQALKALLQRLGVRLRRVFRRMKSTRPQNVRRVCTDLG